MFLGVPEEVEKKKILFPLARTCPSADHLTVKASDLCRTKRHYAVDRRTVPPLGKEHTVAEDVVLAFLERRKDFRTVGAFAVYLGGTEAFGVEYLAELLRRRNERQKHDGLAVTAVCKHFVSDIVKVRVESVSEVSRLVVAVLRSDRRQIHL